MATPEQREYSDKELQEAAIVLSAADSAFWALHNKLLVDGREWSFKGHEYQIEPMNCNAREQCSRKGAQIGWTTIKMIKKMHGLIYNYYPQGVLYFFPTKGDVTDFSKARFAPLISDNKIVSDHIQDTDAANIKRVGKSFLYFRGLKSRSQAKSVPADSLIFDECDEMDPRMIDLAVERLAHSDVKEIDFISTPTLPDYGIDLRWQRSDQRLWMIRCSLCGKDTCLEKEFEDSGWDKQNVLVWRSDKVIRICKHCGRKIYPRNGRWVTTVPSRTKDMVGWWISQLNSALVDPKQILEAFQDPKRNLTETYNSKVGMPYVEAKDRLTVQQVLDLCSSYGISDSDHGPCSMGVDQGKDLHVVIGKKGNPFDKIVHLDVLKDWESLDKLMERFNVFRCVVDALPETRNARAFAERHKGKVFLNYYQIHQKGSYAWNEETLTVTCNRTESLDASHREIVDEIVILPKECEITKEFAEHLHSVAKRLEEDEETGSKRYVYVKLKADHFRHAFNYECMSRQCASRSIFAS